MLQLLSVLPLAALFAGAFCNGISILLLVAALLALLTWFMVGALARKSPVTTLPIAPLLYLGLLLPAVIASTAPNTSWLEWLTLGALPLAWLGADAWRRRAGDCQTCTLEFALDAAAIFFGAWALVDMYLRPHNAAAGPFFDSNSFAAFLDLFLFRAIGSVKQENGISLRQLLIAVLLGLGVMATQSRGSLLADFAAGGLWLLATFGRRNLKPVLLGSAGMLVLLVLGAVWSGRFDHFTTDTSVLSRLAMWKAGVTMIAAHPLLGSGPGTWFLWYPKYQLIQDSQSAGMYAHNDYLQALVEGGPLMLMAFLIPLLVALRGLFKETNLERMGLLAGVLSIAFHAFVNFLLYDLPIAILLGLFLGLALPLAPRVKVPALAKLLPGVGILAGALFLVTGMAAVSANVVLNPYPAPVEKVLLPLGNPRVLASLHWLMPLQSDDALAISKELAVAAFAPVNGVKPVNGRFIVSKAEALRRQNLYLEAMAWGNRAIRREPLRTYPYVFQAFSLMQDAPHMPMFAEGKGLHAVRVVAGRLFKQAMVLDPYYLPAVDGYTQLLVREGKLSEAKAFLAAKIKGTRNAVVIDELKTMPRTWATSNATAAKS